jgi:hypothetical protein
MRIEEAVSKVCDAVSANTRSIARLADNDKKIVAYITRLERRILLLERVTKS